MEPINSNAKGNRSSKRRRPAYIGRNGSVPILLNNVIIIRTHVAKYRMDASGMNRVEGSTSASLPSQHLFWRYIDQNRHEKIKTQSSTYHTHPFHLLTPYQQTEENTSIMVITLLQYRLFNTRYLSLISPQTLACFPFQLPSNV